MDFRAIFYVLPFLWFVSSPNLLLELLVPVETYLLVGPKKRKENFVLVLHGRGT